MTTREAYSMAGALIWAVRVLLLPLVKSRAVIEMIRYLAGHLEVCRSRPRVSSSAMWDEKVEVGHLTPRVGVLVAEILEHPGAFRISRSKKVVILATDASAWGYAICRRGRNGRWHLIEMKKWSQEQAGKRSSGVNCGSW